METYLIQLTSEKNFKQISKYLFDNNKNNAIFNLEEYFKKYENINFKDYSILLLEEYFLLLENEILNYPDFLDKNIIKMTDSRFFITHSINKFLKFKENK